MKKKIANPAEQFTRLYACKRCIPAPDFKTAKGFDNLRYQLVGEITDLGSVDNIWDDLHYNSIYHVEADGAAQLFLKKLRKQDEIVGFCIEMPSGRKFYFGGSINKLEFSTPALGLKLDGKSIKTRIWVYINTGMLDVPVMAKAA